MPVKELVDHTQVDTLVREYKAGRTEVLGDIVHQIHDYINAIIYKRWRQDYPYLSLEDVEDIQQETLISIIQKMHLFRDLSNPHGFSKWVYTCTLNYLRNWVRNTHNRDEKIEFLEDIDEESDQDRPILPHLTETEALVLPQLKEFAQLFWLTFTTLSEEQREIILLRLHGYEYHEIKKILKISEEVIKSRAWRARQRIREELGPYLVNLRALGISSQVIFNALFETAEPGLF